MDYLEHLIQELININCIRTGEFTLKSGLKSDIYVNLRNLISDPIAFQYLLSIISQKLMSMNVLNDIDLIVGIPNAGIPYACHLSFLLNKPMINLRKETKKYGIVGDIDGEWKKGQRVLAIEDVMTTGGSLIDSLEKIKEHGLEIKRILTVVDRQNGGTEKLNELGYDWSSILTLKDIRDFIEGEETRLEVEQTRLPFGADQLPREITPSGPSHVAAYNLKRISEQKGTKIILSADLSRIDDIVDLVQKVAPYICAVKIHCDIIEDWGPDAIDKLKSLKNVYNILIIEDRKWCDIGNTIKLQLNNPLYEYDSWCDIMTVHTIGGHEILQAITMFSANIGLLLVAEMSTRNNLINYQYTFRTVDIARQYNNAIGFICQRRLHNDSFIYCAPGVSLSAKKDTLGQSYNTPRDLLVEKNLDYLIVGRGDIYC